MKTNYQTEMWPDLEEIVAASATKKGYHLPDCEKDARKNLQEDYGFSKKQMAQLKFRRTSVDHETDGGNLVILIDWIISGPSVLIDAINERE